MLIFAGVELGSAAKDMGGVVKFGSSSSVGGGGDDVVGDEEELEELKRRWELENLERSDDFIVTLLTGSVVAGWANDGVGFIVGCIAYFGFWVSRTKAQRKMDASSRVRGGDVAGGEGGVEVMTSGLGGGQSGGVWEGVRRHWVGAMREESMDPEGMMKRFGFIRKEKGQGV
jgi:hypothetical protein